MHTINLQVISKLKPSYMFLRKSPSSERRQYKHKGKLLHKTGHEVPDGEYRYSTTLSLTLALDEVGGKRHTSVAFSPGNPSTCCIGG